jgi:gas vesicle protein
MVDARQATSHDVANSPRADPAADGLPFSLHLELLVQDPETIAELHRYPEGPERDRFALVALRVGVLALRAARGQLDGDTIRREAQHLLQSLQDRLTDHGRAVHERVTTVLREYFDPQNGRFQERVDRLVRRDGELETLLRRLVGSEDSELCKTLLAHLGTDSPLMRLLSPDQSQGLLAALRKTLEEQLLAQREHVLQQFSLDNRESALSRFIAELTERHGELSQGLQERLDEVVRQFSLDDEDSALSRLVRNVDRAQRTITAEFSLDEEHSALSRLKRLLESTQQTINSHLSLDDEGSALARLKRELLTLLKQHGEESRKFQEEVKATVEALAARRAEADRSTLHGLQFEEAVYQQVQHEAQRLGDMVYHVGQSTGMIKHCKKGDVLLELGAEAAAAGARIVLEAKAVAGYTLQEARDEIDEARRNRGAQVGVFVFSRKTAPPGMEPLVRHGDDVFVAWDPEDPQSDLLLRGALSVARALCVRQTQDREAQAADFEALDTAILAVARQAELLDEVRRSAETIQSGSKKILERVRKVREQLESQVEVLQECVANLRDALGDEAGETDY